jgi:hypothetical protein
MFLGPFSRPYWQPAISIDAIDVAFTEDAVRSSVKRGISLVFHFSLRSMAATMPDPQLPGL